MKTKPITNQYLQSASKLLAEAFYNNPAHEYICPDSAKRLNQLKWLLGANLKLQLQNGAKSFCLFDSGKVIAMGYWTNPNNKIGLYKKVGAGLLLAPVKLGLKEFRRMMSVSHYIEKSISNLNLNEPHWYLNNMVVDEESRGKGLGTKILNQEIQKIKERQPNAVFSLTTQKIQNVEFYKKHGFEVVHEENEKSHASDFSNWIMCKY
ncbi:GNAT family N-acetyltransferase [Reichenbachiella sp.]|uniref:GNAT family N-acetyltransferase n=1 Tax=Reichenbachiella sp. TaxID=2184521 RepID=UPI003BB11AA3